MKFKCASFLLLLTTMFSCAQNSPKIQLLVGTYTSGKSEGIYVYEFDTETGEAKYLNKATGIKNPSFLALSADKKNVYAVAENDGGEGGVNAYEYSEANGAMKLLSIARQGENPCYVAVNSTKNHVFAGNYSSGDLAVYPVTKSGGVAEPIQVIKHTGNSINKERQEAAHVHTTVLSPDEKFLLVTNLGTDEVYAYSYNQKDETAPLKLADKIKVAAGSGPRHLAFNKAGNKFYLINELSAEVSVLSFNKGKMKVLQTVSMLGQGTKSNVGAADIHLSPDENFVYASNRGDRNEIVYYKVDEKTGSLTLAGNVPVNGVGPRNFTLDPSGLFLLVGNQKSDKIVVFKRDAATGALTPTNKTIDVGAPVCLVFVK